MADHPIMNATTAAIQKGDREPHHETMWNNPETWIVISFVIFVALFVKYLVPMLNKALDGRSDTIRSQLAQASQLRIEAEAMLATYQREQQKLLKEAESIVANAKKDAAELRERAAEELKIALDRRSQQAQEKIARAETDAVTQIRTHIVESATEVARDMLAQKAQSQSEEQMVASALHAIKAQIH